MSNFTTQEFKLKNGLNVIYNYKKNIKIVDVRLILKAGNFYNSMYSYTPGLAHFLEHIVHEKTLKYKNKSDLTLLIEKYGGQRNAITYNNEKMTFYATVINDYSENAFDYISQVVFYSEFDEIAIEKHKKIIKEELLSSFKNTATKAYLLFNNLAYKESNFSYHTLGTEESLNNITFNELKDYYSNMFITDNCVLSISGDISFENCKKLTEKYFDKISKKESNLISKKIPNLSIKDKLQGHTLVQDKQAIINYGGINVGIDHNLFFSNYLLVGILTWGSNSILNKKLREDNNLVYGVSGVLDINKYFGKLYININTQVDNIQKCIDIIKQEIFKITEGDIDLENIDRSKKIIKSFEIFNDQNIQNEADNLATIKLLFNNINNREEYINKILNINKDEIIESAKYLYCNMNILAICSNTEGISYVF